MTTNIYVENNNIAKKVYNAYIGINNTAKRIVKGYIGINNTAKLFYELEEPNPNIYHLPKEYQQVEYIETRDIPTYSKSPNINTGISLTNKKIFLDFELLGNGGNVWCTGVSEGSSYFYHNNSVFYTRKLCTDGKHYRALKITDYPKNSRIFYLCDTKKNVIKLRNSIIGNKINIGSHNWNDSGIIKLFSANSYTNGGNIRIYHCKIWDTNDQLLIDLIPCYRKNDNKIGMYDIVSKKFIFNEKEDVTYNFLKGEDVFNIELPDPSFTKNYYIEYKNLPNEYKQIEYIQSNGKACIPTGIYGIKSFQLDFTLSKEIGLTYIIGNSKYYNNEWYYCNRIGVGHINRTTFEIGYNNVKKNVPAIIYYNYIRCLYYNIEPNHSFYVDGKKYFEEINDPQDIFQNEEIKLFSCDEEYCAEGIKIFLFRIYSNPQKTILLREFIPCKRISDNAIGLYDLVTNNFFESEGISSLIEGPEVQEGGMDEEPDI